MKIAIIGSGNVGAALGKGWMNAGHDVVFGVRNASSAKTIKALDFIAGAAIKPIADACNESDVIVITTPPDAVIELIARLGDVSNKTIIDTTNSISTKPEGYNTAYHALKDKTGCSRIVKCFNSTGFENMQNPVYNAAGIDMFCAGDNADAKNVAKQLANDLGFANCYNFGDDDKVELLEKFALCWINLAIMQGMGRGIAFKLIKREG